MPGLDLLLKSPYPRLIVFFFSLFVVYVERNISRLVMGSTGNIRKVCLLCEVAVTTGVLRKFMCFPDM